MGRQGAGERGADIKERPILFSEAMILAVLSGAKSQTRRVVKGPLGFLGAGGKSGSDWNDPSCWGWADEYGDFHTLMPDGQSSCDSACCIACPYGKVGDLLWVREAFLPCKGTGDHHPVPIADAVYVCFRDGSQKFRNGHYYQEPPRDQPVDWSAYPAWRPSIHLPRWASRITLEVIDVRVERLRAISEDDAKAEGVEPFQETIGLYPAPWACKGKRTSSHRDAFARLWDGINGKKAGRSWSDNPWVWALSFRRLGEAERGAA